MSKSERSLATKKINCHKNIMLNSTSQSISKIILLILISILIKIFENRKLHIEFKDYLYLD